MSFRLGLTGSIGMGKTTTAGFFRDLGIPVWDADAAVHKLYAKGGAAIAPLGALCDCLSDGAIDRGKLRHEIKKDPQLIQKIEEIVHPLVSADRESFVRHSDAPLVVLDIPLLFETGADVDAVLVVTAPPDVQRARVLARGTMSAADFDMITARQVPDKDKRARADYIIETTDFDSARRAVADLVAKLGQSHA